MTTPMLIESSGRETRYYVNLVC